MDRSEFMGALDRLGWSQAEVARRLDVHVNTVNQWALGRVAVPGYARAYVRVVLLAREMLA